MLLRRDYFKVFILPLQCYSTQFDTGEKWSSTYNQTHLIVPPPFEPNNPYHSFVTLSKGGNGSDKLTEPNSTSLYAIHRHT